MRWRSLLLLLAVPGCATAPGEGGGSDSGPAADGPAGPPQLAGGTWQIRNVSDTPGTLGLHGQQLFVDGQRLIAWSEVGDGGGSDQDILAAVERDDGWDAMPLTTGDQQNTHPSMVTDGDRVYLAWSGRPDALNDLDVYLSIRAGDTWLRAINLTSPAEDGTPRRDTRPHIALGDEGELVVVYLSSPQDESGAAAGPDDVRLLRITAGQIGAPVTVIDGNDGVCSEAVLAVDPEHDSHVVAACSGPSSGLLYANDEELRDRFAVSSLELTDAEVELSPQLHADRAGLHLVFRGDVPCGDARCGEIYYARGTRTGLFTTAVNVSRDEGAIDVLPVVTGDAFGRVLIAFEKQGEIHFTHSTNGVDFSEPERLEPGAPDVGDQPTGLVVDPATGLPSMTFVRTFRGSDPLNLDVFVADRTPGSGGE